MLSGLKKELEISCLYGLVAQVKSSQDNMALKVSERKMPSLTTHAFAFNHLVAWVKKGNEVNQKINWLP